MSFNLAISLFNKMFDAMAHLFRLFIQRSERTYQFLNERISRLEERPTVDAEFLERMRRLEEQPVMDQATLERVVRKVVAETFGGETPSINSNFKTKPPTPSTRRTSPNSDGTHTRPSAPRDTWLDGHLEFTDFRTSCSSDHANLNLEDQNLPGESFRVDTEWIHKYLIAPASTPRSITDGPTPGPSPRDHRPWQYS